ncbi:MAG TPA: hypothetical protein VNJ28_00945, partial [Candidatus Limnocylindrales bacterium]|nr:hypothetical protein [Candidatus Limnocylindrales bacterium]
GGASAGPSAGAANPTPAGNGAARIDACSALTVEEIEAQLGVEMKDGVPSGDNPEISTCTWESVDPRKGAAVVLTIEPYDPDMFEKWHDLATAENPEIPLPGIGDEAFVIGGTVLGGLTVLRKGGTEASLGVIGAFLDRAVVEAARAPLAALVASRI